MPTTCVSCHEPEPDPTRHRWTQYRGEHVWVCANCEPQILAHGLAAQAYVRVEGKERRGPQGVN